MKIVAARPVSEAESATPWAWLPADPATTFTPGGSWAILLNAPLDLERARPLLMLRLQQDRPPGQPRQGLRPVDRCGSHHRLDPVACSEEISEGDQPDAALGGRLPRGPPAGQLPGVGLRRDPVVAPGRPLVGAKPLHEDGQGAEEADGLPGDPHQAAAGVQIGQRDARGDRGGLALERHAEDGVERAWREAGTASAIQCAVGLGRGSMADGRPEEQAAHDQLCRWTRADGASGCSGCRRTGWRSRGEQGHPVQRPGDRRVATAALPTGLCSTLRIAVCTRRLLACRARVIGADRARKIGATMPIRMCWTV